MSQITIETDDKSRLTVDVKLARCLTLIKDKLDTLQPDELGRKVIKLPNVRAELLHIIFHWAKHHHNDPPNIVDPYAPLSTLDKEILDTTMPLIFDLTQTANYLKMAQLENTCCKYVAEKMKNSTIPEIRRTFNIQPPQANAQPPRDAMEMEEERKESYEPPKQNALPGGRTDWL